MRLGGTKSSSVQGNIDGQASKGATSYPSDSSSVVGHHDFRLVPPCARAYVCSRMHKSLVINRQVFPWQHSEGRLPESVCIMRTDLTLLILRLLIDMPVLTSRTPCSCLVEFGITRLSRQCYLSDRHWHALAGNPTT